MSATPGSAAGPTAGRAAPGPARACVARRVAAAWATAVALAAPAALAERADRYKPTNVEADRMNYDDLKQVNVFTGAVVLTKGTITIRGDRMVLRQDPEGYQYGTTTGRLASFRQKRDGVDETVEGVAETVRLAGRARVRGLEGPRVADEIDGAVIVYDSRTEQFAVDGSGQASGPSTGSGRVRVTIQPRLGDAPGGAAPSGAAPGTAGGSAPSGTAPGTPGGTTQGGSAAGASAAPAPRAGTPRPAEPR